ncbi:N-acetyl-gamma-glutamyl-phosphate reductase [Aeromicrobium tamlense]|uniref:N-acetyl-gamma-glutamyl-phosphate reductase n=1 Tax=Aeromicrobium tamlense TaxID=375541 RepID=A0A8I0G064_9ACTN|nr:N-acetyl-gamma-glutamyl-phosphate reductase [Aeromicrobium tamlense]MBD1272291.1 N-acetyl-gamma-glutamyl-phosphate reductase [Aeromicrobium tamlense]NYI38512.1 N-acetyl-gamma-glutamyl-phosphate reductase [Aeromicrobium tamlense]
MIKVAVTGATGYAGGEVLRLLLSHPEVEVGALTAASTAGSRFGQHQPHLLPLADRIVAETTPETLAGHDVVFLALPHGASGAVAAQLPDDVLVIDCGADHRLESSQDWADYYGGEHAGTWPYGMPELITGSSRQRAALAGARRVAVPGCNVTAVTLGLQPAVAAGLVETTDLVAVLANGYSGAGKSLKTHLLASEGLGAALPYAVGGSHRHIPEIAQNLTKAGAPEVTISFTPTLVPMARGILATATARLAEGIDEAQVRAAYEDAYGDEPFLHLLPEGQWPTTAATLGANTAQIQVAVDERAGRLVTVTAIDNLVKGTAGAAVQSMNLALGLPETTGLTTIGVAP